MPPGNGVNSMPAPRLIEIFDSTIDGHYDGVFQTPASETSVHVTGSIDLLTLGLMHDLYGLTAAQFYKEDPERYVRTVLMTLKLLGMTKFLPELAGIWLHR